MSIEETIIGYLAAAIITCLQIPQVIKTYKLGSADELAWGMIILNIMASILWFCYGIILQKIPIYVSNGIYFIANMIITGMKIKFTNNKSTNTTLPTSN